MTISEQKYKGVGQISQLHRTHEVWLEHFTDFLLGQNVFEANADPKVFILLDYITGQVFLITRKVSWIDSIFVFLIDISFEE